MKKRLLIAVLTAGMILQSLALPVQAKEAVPASAEYAAQSLEDLSARIQDKGLEEEEPDRESGGNPAEGKTGGKPGVTEPADEAGENPEETGGGSGEDSEEKKPDGDSEEGSEEKNPDGDSQEDSDEKKPDGDSEEDSEEKKPDSESEENPEEETDNELDENPEEEEPEDGLEEDSGEEETDEPLDEKAENALKQKSDALLSTESVLHSVSGGEGVYQEGSFTVLGESGEPDGSGKTISSMSDADRKEAEAYLYKQLKAKSASIDLSKYGISTSEIRNFVFGVVNDHPDLYFVGNSFSYYSQGTAVTRILPQYIDGMDDAAFQAGLADALAVVEPGMTDLEKAVALHDYIVLNCEYDYDNYLNGSIPRRSYSAYGVLADQTAVCQGYALAYKLLLNQSGIECYMVTSDTMNHAWNLIVLDGEYYQVDVTWDDPVYDRFGLVSHSNMFVSDDEFETRCEHKDWEITRGSSVVNLTADDTRYDDAFWIDVRSPLVIADDACYYIQESDGLVKGTLTSGSEKVIVSSSNIGVWRPVGQSGYYYTGKYSGLFMLGGRLYYNTAERICSVSPENKDIRMETNVLSASDSYVYGSAYCQGEVKYVLKGAPNDAGTILTAELSQETEIPVSRIVMDREKAVLGKGESIKLSAVIYPESARNREITWSSDNPAVAVVSAGKVTAVGSGSCSIAASVDGKNAVCKVTVRPEKPVFTPTGTIDKGGTVTIASEHGEAVYYTVDGQTPAVSGKTTKKYTAPVVLNQDTTIKAIAVDASDPNIISDVAEASFKVCTNNLLIDPQSVTIKEGDKAEIVIKELPTTRTEADVTWKSSDAGVASVNQKGVVTALKGGKASITASVPDHQGRIVTAACEVTVELPVYQVTFIGFGGKVIQTVSVAKGGTAKLPDVTAPVGYEFTGWEGQNTNIQKDCVIRAKYKAIKYQITYHLKGGVNAAGNPGTYTIEDSISLLPASGKDGYLFAGWYEDEECQGRQVAQITQGTHRDIELYAKWRDERGLWLKAADSETDNEIPAQTYTGSIIKPEIEVYYGDTPLIAGTDYTVSYQNNKAANLLRTDAERKKAPTVVIKGKGNYAGTLKKTFKITQQSIEAQEIQIDALAAVYNKGKVIKPVPVVKWNGKKLANKKDFTVEYPDAADSGAYREPGEYVILVKGCGNYTGTRKVKFTISDPANGEILLSKVKISKIPDQSYKAGQAVVFSQDMPKVTMGKETLILGQDYTLEYGECIDIGTYDVIITGKGRYKGARRVSFKIVGEPAKNIKVSKLPSLVYTGEELKQTIGSAKKGLLITDKAGNELKEGVDYTLQYSNNRNVGTAKMILTGKGRYTGTVTKTFKIVQASLAQENKNVQAEFVNGSRNQIYQMGGAQPKVNVTFKGQLLVEGTDYTLRYTNNTSLKAKRGEPTVVITGKKNFKGTRSMTFSIQAKALSDVAVTAADLEENARAGKYMSTPVLTDANGKKLRAGTDYEKQYVYRDENGIILSKTDRPEAGSILTVTVKGKGNYSGEATASFRIIKKGMNISKAKVKVNGSYYYTGDAVTLSKSNLVVTIGKTTLKNDDYEIIGYSNNTKKGTAKVTIKGKGAYGGTKEFTFKILSQNMKWWEKKQ